MWGNGHSLLSDLIVGQSGLIALGKKKKTRGSGCGGGGEDEQKSIIRWTMKRNDAQDSVCAISNDLIEGETESYHTKIDFKESMGIFYTKIIYN